MKSPENNGKVQRLGKRKYAEESLNAAVGAVKLSMMSIGKASTFFGVPKSTIRFRIGRTWSGKLQRGPNTMLTSDEEEKVIKWVKDLEKRGFPCTKQGILAKVTAFLKINSRKTVFRDGSPGKMRYNTNGNKTLIFPYYFRAQMVHSFFEKAP